MNLLPFVLIVSLLINIVAFGQRRSQQTTPAQKRPRLVLLIAVDQFRYDYLDRFGDLFVSNGLQRLLRDGASWT